MDTMITVDNLGKRYAGKQAITNLSFTVPDGQVTGFLGPNGAGKSTTMRCMLGLDKPTTGQALVDGAEFAGLRDKASHVGALLEASWFNPSRSGRSHLQVLARGAGAHVWDVDGNEYVEYGMGLRSVTLGHGFRPVVDAVTSAVAAPRDVTRLDRFFAADRTLFQDAARRGIRAAPEDPWDAAIREVFAVTSEG